MAQVRDFDVSQLAGVLIVCGHYGVGKTALSLSLAKDAARAGKRVSLIDLDVVNPYFRSSDQAQSLRAAGISVITPVYAGPDCNIDMPALTGAVAPAIERASSDAGELCVIDVGGDDAGAAALGRFSHTIASAPYEMWYVAAVCPRSGMCGGSAACCRLRSRILRGCGEGAAFPRGRRRGALRNKSLSANAVE